MSTPCVYLWIHITLDIDVEIMQKSNISNNVKLCHRGNFFINLNLFWSSKQRFHWCAHGSLTTAGQM